MTRKAFSIVFFLAAFCVLTAANAATLTVTNGNDSGDGSLCKAV